MSPTVRAATPDDAPLVAQALQTASDGLMSSLLGSRWADVIASVVAVPGHAWSWDRARIAEHDGSPVGVSLSSAGTTASPDPVIERSAGTALARLTLVSLAAAPVLRFMDRHAEGEWYLTAVAVDEASRGQGVGQVLIADVVRIAGEHGSHALTLDVDVRNTGARRLYERLDFVETARSRRAWLVGGAQVVRMSRVLT